MAGRFVISCAARTGSTMLRLMLNSHSEVCCHGEVFSPVLRGFVGLDTETPSPLLERVSAVREQSPEVFLRDYVFLGSERFTVGFKFKYTEMHQPHWLSASQAVLGDRAIRFIHLRRRDHVRRYVSEAVTVRTGINLIVRESERPVVAPFPIDLAELLSDVQRTQDSEAQCAALLQHHDVLDLFYEDLTSPDTATETLLRLQAFLELPPETLTTPTLRLGRPDLSSTISNWSDLLPALTARGLA